MPNNYMKIYATYFTRKVQNKTTRYHNTPSGRAKICTMTTPNVGEDEKQQELSFLLAETQTDTVTLEDILAVFFKTKLNMVLLHITFQLLGNYLTDLKNYITKNLGECL